MALSLNGWPVIPSWSDPRLRTITVPGTNKQIRVRRCAAPLFAAFLADWQAEMPHRLKLTSGRQYLAGYNYRPSRMGGWSNHSSGTAVDVRWDVLLADNRRHMTDEEQAILRRILHRYRTDDGHHVLGNGYAWRSVDEMHTELSQSWQPGSLRRTTRADVMAVRRRLGITRNGIRTKTGAGNPRKRKTA